MQGPHVRATSGLQVHGPILSYAVVMGWPNANTARHRCTTPVEFGNLDAQYAAHPGTSNDRKSWPRLLGGQLISSCSFRYMFNYTVGKSQPLGVAGSQAGQSYIATLTAFCVYNPCSQHIAELGSRRRLQVKKAMGEKWLCRALAGQVVRILGNDAPNDPPKYPTQVLASRNHS